MKLIELPLNSMKNSICIFLSFISATAYTQSSPLFEAPITVTINGWDSDAMEPLISPDGNTLYFNSLNDGVETKLYFASRITDSTFTFQGEVNGANQLAPPQLDAVADLDENGNFYWTSTRDYPIELDNLFRGTLDGDEVTAIARVHGNFNRSTPGWLVMDHGISLDGETLYYNNARFDEENCTGPCETELGIAAKVDATTFTKLSNSNDVLSTIINPDYIYYAPCISSDNLELYYTRYLAADISPTTEFEICVAVRESDDDNFSEPTVLFSASIANLVEAPSLTIDKSKMYYHQKTPGSHKILLRYREFELSSSTNQKLEKALEVFPNPTNGTMFIVTTLEYKSMGIDVYNISGNQIYSNLRKNEIDMSRLPAGNYIFKIEVDDAVATKLVVKE